MLNKVMLIGNVGNDPETRTTQGGVPVCNIRLATNERYKDRNGETQERTEWHSLVLWNRLAEIARDHVRKGDRIYIEGRLRTREWEDREGIKRRTTEIFVDAMRFLSTRNGNGQAQGAARSHGNGARRQPQPAAAVTPENDPFYSGPDGVPEDVPF